MKRLSILVFVFTFFAFSAFSQEPTWKTFSAGGVAFFSIKSDGTLWGSGRYLGDGALVNRNIPVQIGMDTAWRNIASGSSHTLALKNDGSLWGWGTNIFGQVGDGSTEDKLSPVRIGTDKWLSVGAGTYTSVGIKADGSIWGWGSGLFGGVGDGTTSQRNSPVQILWPANWLRLSVGAWHSVALRSDGTLWGWGSYGAGELGASVPATGGLSPFQVGVDNDWVDVYAGYNCTLALKNNGTLWAWGLNDFGQLGDGTNVNKSLPVQVGTENQWKEIGGGDWFSLAVKNDGTLWAWGRNDRGQLGDGTLIDRTTPVQISGHNNPKQIARGVFTWYSALLSPDSKTLCFTGFNEGQFGNGVSNDTLNVYSCANSYCLSYTLPTTTTAHSLPVGGPINWVDFQTSCLLSTSIMPNGANPVTGEIRDSVWIEPTVPVAGGQPYVQRHYGITPLTNPGTATATITLYYTQADFDAYNAVAGHGLDLPHDPMDAAGYRNNLRIVKRSGTSNDGTGLYDAYTGGKQVIIPSTVDWDTSLNAWAVTFNVTGFSGFFATSSSFVLPVRLVDFTARLLNGDGALTWQTTAEEELSSYEVERSSDGRTFATASRVPALGQSGSWQYSYTDKQITTLGLPVVYYRLKMVNTDGTFSYSKVMPVNISSRGAVVSLYPNPVKGTATLSLSALRAETLRYRIVDAFGRTVLEKTITVRSGLNTLPIETQALPSGSYTLLARGSTTVQEVKFIKQ